LLTASILLLLGLGFLIVASLLMFTLVTAILA
jgi:hypothetical protein